MEVIENQMVVRNGYGKRDSQEEESHPAWDELGSEIFEEDEVLVSPDEDETLLPENAVRYLIEVLGWRKKVAGE